MQACECGLGHGPDSRRCGGLRSEWNAPGPSTAAASFAVALDPDIRDRLVLPAVCAPMMLVSGPELVTAACKAGLMAGLPAHNARDLDEFTRWMEQIRRNLQSYGETDVPKQVGLLAVNIPAARPLHEIESYLNVCRRFGVRVIISAMGDPRALVERAHDVGCMVFHDVTTIRHAEKAIDAGVDGLVCIGAGGGGHCGLVSHLALIPKVRSMFDGTIVLAGCAASGAAIRAAEVLGADLCYLGTRFIATREARASAEYKDLLVAGGARDLVFTDRISGVGANWLKASLRNRGIDPENPPSASAPRNYDHLPEGVRPWRDLWSAGQGLEMIDDIPTVAELVQRLRREYVSACMTPDMLSVARRAR